MNVKKLIAALSELPEDWDVKISIWDDFSDNPDVDYVILGVDEYGYLHYGRGGGSDGC